MFPLDPSVGDVYDNYEWNGVAWKFIGYEKINDYAPKDSPAITGVASLPSTTTIGVVNNNEIEKLYGITGQLATTQYVTEQIAATLAGLTGGSVTFTQPTIDTPAGTILMFGGLAAPFGYLLCDGTAVDRTSYSGLFAVIGTIYGSGNGTTTFNLPNLKGRTSVGRDAAQLAFDTVGEVGGANTHQHASANTGSSGSHSHNTTDHSHNTTDHSHNTADHSHYSDHSHYADHSHGVNPGATTTGGSSSNNSVTLGSGFSHANSGHTHTVNIATFTSANANGAGITTGNSNYGNTGGANAGNTTSGASTGNTTSGASDGNLTTTEPAHTHTIQASDVASNFQPYMVLNYIIKT